MATRGAARPTKADVARLANVSAATVSYVLNNVTSQSISAQTRAAVHDAANPPMLIDERSGAVINELLMGHIHSYAPRAGLTYYLIFVNKGNLVRSGSRVTVRLGDARLAHVVVR